MLEALACSGAASENVPLTRRPVAVGLGSATDSDTFSAVEVTEAVIVVEYSRARPGMNWEKAPGVPSVRTSVGGVSPPMGPLTGWTE